MKDVKCPRCGSDDATRSARRGIERNLGFLPWRPFRCRACGRRFWRREPAGWTDQTRLP